LREARYPQDVDHAWRVIHRGFRAVSDADRLTVMPFQPGRPRQLEWRVFRGADARQRKLITASQLRSAAWTRLRHDVYADARLERDHELACRAAALTLPAHAAIAGTSAAVLHGVLHGAQAQDDVHVVAPPPLRMSPRQGLIVHATALEPNDVLSRSGMLMTTPSRTAWDVASWSDVVSAVAVIDGLLGCGAVARTDLDRLLETREGQRGWRRAVEAFSLADGRAQSPPESQLRIRLVLAGLPKPVAQHAVPLPSGVTVHPDLAWPEFKVAVEYDGQWHADADQLHRDRRRLNQLVAAGWIVLHVTSQRLRRDFAGLVREVRAALTSRGWRP
jgi:hypothetical protein